MKIKLLGTGTPTPSLKRMCSGYVVEIGADVIVFDHGFGAHHRLLELGIPPTRVTHFFCSHLHYDHCADSSKIADGRTDGHGLKRAIAVVTAQKFRLTMECAEGSPGVAEFQLYRPE